MNETIFVRLNALRKIIDLSNISTRKTLKTIKNSKRLNSISSFQIVRSIARS